MKQKKEIAKSTENNSLCRLNKVNEKSFGACKTVKGMECNEEIIQSTGRKNKTGQEYRNLQNNSDRIFNKQG